MLAYLTPKVRSGLTGTEMPGALQVSFCCSRRKSPLRILTLQDVNFYARCHSQISLKNDKRIVIPPAKCSISDFKCLSLAAYPSCSV